jgi:phage repressor protein C with HTH and peptisase S24 domain
MGARKRRPEWAEKLELLRGKLGLSQAALARKLNVSAMAPSRWERGVHEPPASIYLELGKMAGPKECWYFWGQAGLKKSDVQAVLGKSTSKSDFFISASPGLEINGQKVVVVPVYPMDCCSPPRKASAEFVAVPAAWVPNPKTTYCVKLVGDFMSPMLRAGAIVGIDESFNDYTTLEGKMVLGTHKEKGGVIHWLQKIGPSLVLVPENRNHPPTYIQNNDWTIGGKILWWFSTAPAIFPEATR